MNGEKRLVVGLGELLWDVLPDARLLGGAPANFAYHAALLGDEGVVASRVGDDDLGREAIARLARLGLDTRHVQVDRARPTGTVDVRLDERGRPDFTIAGDVAWDFIEWTPELEELASAADAVCFGTLAQRSPASAGTIRRFLDAAPAGAVRVFDINLRQAFYSAETIAQSLGLARIVKLNDEELPRVAALLGLGAGDELASARAIIEAFGPDLVCVTRGDAGSLLATATGAAEHPGCKVEVADSVGAGDAFTAALVHHYLRGRPLGAMSEAANRMGAWVASSAGATPEAAPDVIKEVVRA